MLDLLQNLSNKFYFYHIKSVKRQINQNLSNAFLSSWLKIVDYYQESEYEKISTVVYNLISVEFLREKENIKDDERDCYSNVKEKIVDEDLENYKKINFELLKYLWKDMYEYIPDSEIFKELISSESIKLISNREYSKHVRKISSDKREIKSRAKKYGISKRKLRLYEKSVKIDDMDIGINSILIFISILFICSGFVYNFTFFGYFNINPSNFFNTTDYLSSSVDTIYSLVFSFVFGALFGLYAFPEVLFGDIPEIKNKKTGKLFDKYFIPFVVFFMFASTIYTFYRGDDLFYNQFSFSMVLLFVYISSQLAIFFKNPIRGYFFSLFLFNYIFMIAFSSITYIHDLKTKDIGDLKRYNIVDTDNRVYSDYVLVSSNSRYHFLYNKGSGNIDIVKIDDIKKISSMDKRKRGFFYTYLVDRFLPKSDD